MVPTFQKDLEQMISSGLREFDSEVQAWWERVKIPPFKWRCSPFGDLGGWFWVVAEIGRLVLWYNDIEDGFNLSPYNVRGTIDEYQCNQTSFVEFLHGVADQSGQEIWPTLNVGEVPSTLLTGGSVVLRQSTYWDLRSHALASCRVHFRNKAEFRFTSSHYESAILVTEHSVLANYNEGWECVDIASTVPEPSSLLVSLDAVVARPSCGWHKFVDYANQSFPIFDLLIPQDEPALDLGRSATSALETWCKSLWGCVWSSDGVRS